MRAEAGSEIVLEVPAVLKLVQQALFTRDGKFDVRTGPCYAYFEYPSVTLDQGRVLIRSRLSGRFGTVIGGSCLGLGLASWTVVSGVPAGVEGTLLLTNLRIDSIEDKTTDVLVRSGLLPRLPKALEVDVRKALEGLLQGAGGGLESRLDAFRFSEVSTDGGVLTLKFDFRLRAR